MKFTDGYWLTRPGLAPLYAVEVDDIRRDDRAGTMTVFAPTGVVRDRGDTLNRAMLTVTFSAPMPGVIKVRVERHAGAVEHGPDFEIFGAEGFRPTIELDDDSGVIESGPLRARVARSGPWRVDFESHGRSLTTSLPRSVGHVTRAGAYDETWMHQQLTIEPGERVYGLGERFGAFVKNGQVVDSGTRTAEPRSEQAYKNVPFYMTNRGYGVFVDIPANVSFEVGSEASARPVLRRGRILEYFVIYGPEPKDVLRRYTALTGRPALLPAWSFGLWLSHVVHDRLRRGDRQRRSSTAWPSADIPLSVFHFDCFWMREFHWCDFEWDPPTFPDPDGHAARGCTSTALKVCVWINPYIAQRSRAVRARARRDGLPGQARRRQRLAVGPVAGRAWALVDFTNPAARAWYQAQAARADRPGRRLLQDRLRRAHPDRRRLARRLRPGADAQLLHAAVQRGRLRRAARSTAGEGEAVVFARSATAGGQQFPVHWGGDSDSTFVSMAESLRGGLSLALSRLRLLEPRHRRLRGHPGPGGVQALAGVRAAVVAQPAARVSESYRVPWAFDDEAVDVAARSSPG